MRAPSSARSCRKPWTVPTSKHASALLDLLDTTICQTSIDPRNGSHTPSMVSTPQEQVDLQYVFSLNGVIETQSC